MKSASSPPAPASPPISFRSTEGLLMRVNVDTERRRLEIDGKSMDLYGDEAFRVLSDLWVKVGWNQRVAVTS